MNGYAYKNIFHLYKKCRTIHGLDILQTERVSEQIRIICLAREKRDAAKSITPDTAWIFPELN
jgi:hypothetical protein